MKRNVTLLLIFLGCFLGTTKAQITKFRPEFYIGGGAGMLFSKVDLVPSVLQTFHQGMYAGVSAKYISEKHLGLIVEANLANRGWTEEYNDNADYSYSRSLTYLEVPFMTHIYFGNDVRFIINIGPQISFLLNDKEDMSQALADDIAGQEAVSPGPNDRYNPSDVKFDYGITGGIGMAFRSGIGDFDVEGRYYFGLGDIFKSSRGDQAYYSRSANRVIEAKLTYYLKIF